MLFMGPLPPRPERKLAPEPEEGFDVEVPEPSLPPPAMPAEADEGTRHRLIDAMLKAAAAELGQVRISSVPPEPSEPEPPRSSIRVAAKVGGKYALKGVTLTGAVTLIASVIALWKPEYKMPLAQAFKLFGALFTTLGNALAGAPSDAP